MYSKRTKVHEWMHLSESSYGKHQCVIRHPETKTMQDNEKGHKDRRREKEGTRQEKS